MGFTTAAFIRRNTPELRKKLEELGYKCSSLRRDRSCLYIAAYLNSYHSIHPEWFDNKFFRKPYDIDCGDSENLFLAIAALRDDTSANQYWVFDQDFPPHYQKGDFTIGHFHRCSCYCHNATVEELIEHFKEKEENHG